MGLICEGVCTVNALGFSYKIQSAAHSVNIFGRNWCLTKHSDQKGAKGRGMKAYPEEKLHVRNNRNALENILKVR